MVLLSLPWRRKERLPLPATPVPPQSTTFHPFPSPFLCFHTVTNCKFSNSFLLTFMQIGGGWRTPRLHSSLYTPVHSSTRPTKPFRISAHFARSWCHLSPFRINTSKSVSKQMTLSTFRMNTYEKQGEGWPVIVNQESDKDSCPACPEPRREQSAVADDEGSVNSELSTSPMSLFHGTRIMLSRRNIRSSSQASHICYSGTSK